MKKIALAAVVLGFALPVQIPLPANAFGPPEPSQPAGSHPEPSTPGTTEGQTVVVDQQTVWVWIGGYWVLTSPQVSGGAQSSSEGLSSGSLGLPSTGN